ncbi:hypothetical protein [Collimonas fungivorans]|uniref:hypothetical protein n=1 Tax=Collimonas fungivorans TaxID=158899 RepID=UPI003FA3A4F8
MAKKFSRMNESAIKSMIFDLDKWASGQLGSKLTWAVLEDRFGFSRQSLQARPEIKAAYDNAKQSLAGELVRAKENAVKENNALLLELGRAQLEIAEYKRKEKLWLLRWQRIAFHIRQKGHQVYSIDRQIPHGSEPPSERATAEILRPFDKEIPSSGRL